MWCSLSKDLLLICFSLLYHLSEALIYPNKSRKRGCNVCTYYSLFFWTYCLRVIPLSTVVLDERIGFGWTPCARFVRVDGAGRHILPYTDDAVYDAPGCFNLVTTNEERCVSDHTIGY